MQNIINQKKRSDLRVFLPLLILSLIPILAGMSRIAELSQGGPITPDNARFHKLPLPVIIHIITASLYCILGALQFGTNFRLKFPGWHKIVGRILLPCGILAALSGIYMTFSYELPADLQGPLLFGFRILIGLAMVLCLVFGLSTIIRKNIKSHKAWMIRAYAIGQGAGTQVVILLPITLMFGESHYILRDILMILAWLINIVIGELIIRKKVN